jgi:hypothetical protein
MKKQLLLTIGIALLVGGISFYGGMQYGKSVAPARGNSAYQQRAGSFNGIPRTTGGLGQGGGFSSGEIISKDANMLTIKLSSGSTALVLLSASTSVNKFSAGTMDDLTVGNHVMVTGDKNSDGSLSAKAIQIEPIQSAAPKPQGQ